MSRACRIKRNNFPKSTSESLQTTYFDLIFCLDLNKLRWKGCMLKTSCIIGNIFYAENIFVVNALAFLMEIDVNFCWSENFASR